MQCFLTCTYVLVRLVLFGYLSVVCHYRIIRQLLYVYVLHCVNYTD